MNTELKSMLLVFVISILCVLVFAYSFYRVTFGPSDKKNKKAH